MASESWHGPIMSSISPAIDPASTDRSGDRPPTPHQRLKTIADELLTKGVVPPTETVRSLLRWFRAERRGDNILTTIRRTLAEVGLETDPDFEYAAAIDQEISFRVAGTSSGPDATYRIGRLESANRKPLSIARDAILTEATTLMLLNDYSQLPVMTTDREVKGVISWKSIGSHLSMGKTCKLVRECMSQSVEVISSDVSLFSAIDVIVKNDFVLVRANDKSICGIVTASDLSSQFRQLAEPFLLIGEIESHVRRLIHGKFRVQELQKVDDSGDASRSIDGVEDLTFGEYVRLLENENRWSKLNLKGVHRCQFVKGLDRVREIRNNVMHFDPDGLGEDDLKTLRDFTRFLRSLRELSS